MGIHEHTVQRDAIVAAIEAQDWTSVESLATDLRRELEEIVRRRSRRGHEGDVARAYHRSGLYTIGWQTFLRAPPRVRQQLDRLNGLIASLPFKA